MSERKEKNGRALAEGRKHWPCEQAIRALVYAGWPYRSVKANLESWYLPAPDYLLRPLYDSIRQEALRISPNLEFTQQQVRDIGIKPLYNWAVSDDRNPVCKEDTLLVSSTHNILSVRLMEMVCTMLFYMWSEERIATALTKCDDKPPRIWNAEQVFFFRQFYWDPYNMGETDWNAYVRLEDYAQAIKCCFEHIKKASYQDAFIKIGVINGMEDSSKIDFGIQVAYMRAIEYMKSANPQLYKKGIEGMLAIVKMIASKNKKVDSSGELERALDNLRERIMDPEQVNLMSVGDIVGEVSDYEEMRQRQDVVEAEKNRFASYEG